MQRRDFLTSFASVGVVGASTLALAQMGRAQAAQTGGARYGRGPAIEGPYLDLRTGKGNQLA